MTDIEITIKSRIDDLMSMIDELEDIVNTSISNGYDPVNAVKDQDIIMSINLSIFQIEYLTIMARCDDIFKEDIAHMRVISKEILDKITDHFHA